MQLGDDGKVSGYGKSRKGDFKIEGEHGNKTITFKKIVDNDRKKKITLYKGNFVDSLTVEGTYNYGKTTSNFRIWISDDLCPGLSVIQGEQTKKKKIDPLPEEYLTWHGYWIQGGHQGDMRDLQIKLENNGKVSGKGLDQYGPFLIDGHHRNYSEISFTKKMDIPNGWSIYYDGTFNGKTYEGLYVVGSEKNKMIGKFRMWIEDPRYPVPKEEEEDDDTYPEKPLRWDGFYVEFGEQGPMEICLQLNKNGTLEGESTIVTDNYTEEECSIEGTHENYSKIKFIETRINEGTITHYMGQFVEYGLIEGIYKTTSKDNKRSGKFKMWLVR